MKRCWVRSRPSEISDSTASAASATWNGSSLPGLAHNLGLEVIAEGVETDAQLDHLKLLGCEFAQGFNVSAPLRPEDATALLQDLALRA